MSSQCPLLRYCCQGLGQSADLWTIVSDLSACRHSQSWQELINVTGLQQSPPSKEHSGVLAWSWQYLKISFFIPLKTIYGGQIFLWSSTVINFVRFVQLSQLHTSNLTKLKTSRTSIYHIFNSYPSPTTYRKILQPADRSLSSSSIKSGTPRTSHSSYLHSHSEQ